MRVVAATFIQMLVGAPALSISQSLNSTRGFDLDFSAKMLQLEPCDVVQADTCDSASTAKGDLTAQFPLRPFFLKFEEVGGNPLMHLLNTVVGVTSGCGRSCGHCSCSGEAKACTGHNGKNVFANYLLADRKRRKQSFLFSVHASVDEDLIPIESRRKLFKWIPGALNGDGGVPLSWIPDDSDSHAGVLFVTLLRDPVERVRSKYYSQRSQRTCQEPCLAKQLSFNDWMRQFKDDHSTCCEYVATLGLGSLSRAKKVLASVFDVVGISEEMPDVYEDVAKHFGIPAHHLPEQITCEGNTVHMEEWTHEQKRIAEIIVAEDSELYEFARHLKRRRREDLYGREAMMMTKLLAKRKSRAENLVRASNAIEEEDALNTVQKKDA